MSDDGEIPGPSFTTGKAQVLFIDTLNSDYTIYMLIAPPALISSEYLIDQAILVTRCPVPTSTKSAVHTRHAMRGGTGVC